MLSEKTMQMIKDKKIISRRQLYFRVGRSKKLLQYLNENNILMSKQRWNKDRIKGKLFQLESKLGRIPLARDDWGLTALAQRHFKSWNDALMETFGKVNQERYDDMSDKELLLQITSYIEFYQRLPLRSEFNGSSREYPDYETYIRRFNLNRWSDIFKIINVEHMHYYTKHGYGKIRILNGIVYLSNEEYLIGKFLENNNIKFKKEVPYGNSNHIFDFYLPTYDTYIEYYGIATKEYKVKIEEKRSYYNERNVIEIFKHDNTIKKLAFEVQRL